MRHNFSHFSLRLMERVLPVEAFYSILRPGALARAALRAGFKTAPPPIVLPGCFNPGGTIRVPRLSRADFYLHRTLHCVADRLVTPKWAGRIHLAGTENLRPALDAKRPVVLTTCHFGPFLLLSCLLRAAGISAAALVGEGPPKDPRVQPLLDPDSPFPDLPTTFYRSNLRQAAEYLEAGNVLALTLDFPSGRQLQVPLPDGWSFQIATGALRLAVRHGAELIPCCIFDEGRWRYRIEFGSPVPGEFLAPESDLVSAGQHLLKEFLVRFQSRPDQCPEHLIRLFRQTPPQSPGGEPGG